VDQVHLILDTGRGGIDCRLVRFSPPAPKMGLESEGRGCSYSYRHAARVAPENNRFHDAVRLYVMVFLVADEHASFALRRHRIARNRIRTRKIPVAAAEITLIVKERVFQDLYALCRVDKRQGRVGNGKTTASIIESPLGHDIRT